MYKGTIIRLCKNSAEFAEKKIIGFSADREQTCNSKGCGP